MLQDPSAYLLQQNKALLKSATGMGDMYEELMTDIVKDIVKAISGTSDKNSDEYKAAAGQLWVKSLVQDLTAKVKLTELGIIDIKYPILGSAYKAQKSKNSRELEAKRSLSRKGLSNYIHN